MKESLLQMARYNIWANKCLIKLLLSLDGAQLDREINSSFSSLRRTAYHMWSAEFVWLQRLQLVEKPIWVETGFAGDAKEAFAAWEEASQSLLRFIESRRDDRVLEHMVMYHTMAHEPFKTSEQDILLHAFNHATFHRGQLVTMLRQAGVTKIPATDLIVFLRKFR